MTLAEIVLKDLIPEGGEPEVTAGLIIAQTASYFGFSIEDLCGPSRTRALVTAPVAEPTMLADVVRRLDDAGIAVGELGLRRASLDEVFLTLTGHPAEDEERGAA